MTREQVKDWLNMYVEAWKSYDLVHILRRAPDGQS